MIDIFLFQGKKSQDDLEEVTHKVFFDVEIGVNLLVCFLHLTVKKIIHYLGNINPLKICELDESFI